MQNGAGCNAFVCFTLVSLFSLSHLESLSRKALICSAAPYTFNSFFSRARDCTTFTLHDLTDFYVEIKINDHSLAKLIRN